MIRGKLSHTHLLAAQSAMQQGAMSDAMRELCAALLAHLIQVDTQRALALLPVPEFLECGVRFVVSETGLRAEFTRLEFSEQDVVRALGLCKPLLDAALPRTLCERVHALLQRCSVRLMLSARPTPMSALALRGLYQGKMLLRPCLPGPRRRDDASALLISLLLKEPLARARVLLRRHGLVQETLRLRQQQALGVNGSPQWPDREAYRAWLRRNPGSRVLVTLHMGHYREAYHWLAAEAEPGRRVISLQRELDDTSRHLHQVDPRHHYQVLGQQSATSAAVVAALRAGNTTLAILCDLGPRFGDTEPVSLFGFPAHLVRGPALLAILGKAPLLPFVMVSCNGRDCLTLAPAISPTLQPGETLAQGVRRITTSLAQCLERWVRMAPEQWRFLPAAGMFLSAPTEAARHER